MFRLNSECMEKLRTLTPQGSGGSRPLPELFQAAGGQFEFDAATIKPLI
jgi:hypothetical protein